MTGVVTARLENHMYVQRPISEQTGNELEVLAKIDETAGKKFENTTIHSTRANGETLITEIRPGATKTRVAFP